MIGISTGISTRRVANVPIAAILEMSTSVNNLSHEPPLARANIALCADYLLRTTIWVS